MVLINLNDEVLESVAEFRDRPQKECDHLRELITAAAIKEAKRLEFATPKLVAEDVVEYLTKFNDWDRYTGDEDLDSTSAAVEVDTAFGELIDKCFDAIGELNAEAYIEIKKSISGNPYVMQFEVERWRYSVLESLAFDKYLSIVEASEM